MSFVSWQAMECRGGDGVPAGCVLGHRSVGARGSVLVSGLALLRCGLLLLLLLLEKIMLPVKLLSLRVHVLGVSG